MGEDARISSFEPTTPDLAYDVIVTIPLVRPELCEAIALALHHAQRRLGVAHGGRADRSQFWLLGVAPSEAEARARATELMEIALPAAGAPREVRADVVIEGTRARARRAGRPRRVTAPDNLHYASVELADGRTLRAHSEGALGDWIVYVGTDRDGAWAGRWLLAVIDDLLELPFGLKEPGVYEAIEQLAGHETALGVRYACPCCDCLTLEEPPTGTHAICPVCWWEDDLVQFEDPAQSGDANRVSLLEARENYRRLGIAERPDKHHARPPLPEELPPGNDEGPA